MLKAPHVVAPAARVESIGFILSVVDVHKHIQEGFALHLGTRNQPVKDAAAVYFHDVL